MASDTALKFFIMICEKPLMVVDAKRFTAVAAFIHGYNMALHGGALIGFREWLLIGREDWTNLSWSQLIWQRYDPEADLSRPPSLEDDEALLGELQQALDAFLKDNNELGLDGIYHRYNTWLLSQTNPVSADRRIRIRKCAYKARTQSKRRSRKRM